MTRRLLVAAGRMRRGGESDELLAAHVAASETVCEVLPADLAFELDTRPVLVDDNGAAAHPRPSGALG